jgi:AraC-like DNA-binding protein
MELFTRTLILFHQRSSYENYATGVRRALSDHDFDVRVSSDSASTEIRRLKDCIGDLLSVSAIQAISRGSGPGHIIGSLLEVLVGTLRLHLAYAEFKATDTGIPIALARFSQLPKSNALPPAIRAPVDDWLADESRTSPFVIPCQSRDGDLSLALVNLGLRTEVGWLLVCSSRKDFPTQTERLILGVAANQAVIGLQQAQLRAEQTRMAQELERKVRQRTRELGTANAELGRALKQIDLLRDDLLRENLVLREQAAGTRGGLAPWQLKRAEALMSENLSVQVPLGQVAEECGLSVRHLARAFRQSTGVPPHRWLLDRRVKRAKELLPNSELSLSDVALACGFGDQSHFTRTFTAAVRLSPGVWRRLQSSP